MYWQIICIYLSHTTVMVPVCYLFTKCCPKLGGRFLRASQCVFPDNSWHSSPYLVMSNKNPAMGPKVMKSRHKSCPVLLIESLISELIYLFLHDDL